MAIELSVRGTGQDQAQSLVVQTGVSLKRATDIALSADTPAVVRHEKVGRDLAVQFEDGQTLRIGNFFVIDPEGDFSRFIDETGEPAVTGLTAPEPSLDDMAGSFEADPEPAGGGPAEDAAGPRATGGIDGPVDSTEDAGDGGGLFGGGSTVLSAGAGLAAGFGSMNLLSSDDDDGDGDDGAQASGAVLGEAESHDGSLEDDLNALLGEPEAEDGIAQALAMAFPDATLEVVGTDAGENSGSLIFGSPQESGPSGPVFGDTAYFSAEMQPDADLLLSSTPEGEI